jgi:hypothetical protein
VTGAAAASCASGHLDAFVVGSDNAIYQISFNGAWGSWRRLGGIATSTPGATCPSGTGNDGLYVRGTDQGLWQTTVIGG